jgi:integrase
MPGPWVYQDDKQVKKHGAESASWYVGWYDPEGKRRCKNCGRDKAEKLRRKLDAQLLTGTYEGQSKAEWADFRKEWEEKVGAGLERSTREVTLDALNHFQRLNNPRRTQFITARYIDHYVAQCWQERGRRRGSTVSAATVNKELRHIRAVLRVAKDWGYLPEVPRFRMLREPVKLPRYVTGDHFAAIYAACDAARLPRGLPYPAADWWRALMVTGYMTGWRIGDMLGMWREDLDLDAATVMTRWSDNKGKRDELVKLHPVVVEHLRRAPGFGPTVLPWDHDERTLYPEFARNPGGGRRPPDLPGGARAQPPLPRLRLPRPQAGVRHDERRQADARRPTGADAAQELHDDAAVHQHGAADGRRGGGAARPGGVGGVKEARLGAERVVALPGLTPKHAACHHEGAVEHDERAGEAVEAYRPGVALVVGAFRQRSPTRPVPPVGDVRTDQEHDEGVGHEQPSVEAWWRDRRWEST